MQVFTLTMHDTDKSARDDADWVLGVYTTEALAKAAAQRYEDSECGREEGDEFTVTFDDDNRAEASLYGCSYFVTGKAIDDTNF